MSDDVGCCLVVPEEFRRLRHSLPELSVLARLELAVKARRIGQVIVALLAWALFGYHWYLVTQRRFGSSTLEALQLLVTLVLVIWAATTLWVHHNRWHFANRPDRRVRRTGGVEMGEHDALGHQVQVEGSDETIKDAGYLVVDVDPAAGQKTFRVAEVPDEEAAA